MRMQLGGHHCKLLIQLWKEEILGCVVTTRCVTGSVYFKLTQNRKGKRLGGLWTTEPLGKTMKPKRSFLKTRCRVLIVSRQRNDFNVKATNRPPAPVARQFHVLGRLRRRQFCQDITDTAGQVLRHQSGIVPFA